MSRTTLKTVCNTNGYYRINNLSVNIDLKKNDNFFSIDDTHFTNFLRYTRSSNVNIFGNNSTTIQRRGSER